jgi:hypothetical protein
MVGCALLHDQERLKDGGVWYAFEYISVEAKCILRSGMAERYGCDCCWVRVSSRSLIYYQSLISLRHDTRRSNTISRVRRFLVRGRVAIGRLLSFKLCRIVSEDCSIECLTTTVN